MLVFTNRFLKEYQQFQKLGNTGKQLIASVFSYNFIHPIFALFVNAFLWRQSQDIFLVALYNLAFFAFLPVGFYLNGLLIKHKFINLVQGYTIGGVSRSLAVFLLIFAPHLTTATILLFGSIYGLCSGVFWATRNYLSLKATQSNNRIYFSSLDMISGTFTNIIVPLAVGAFIIYGTTINLYTPIQGYYVVAFVLIAVSILSGWQIRKLTIRPTISQLLVTHSSPHWTQSRAVMSIFGIMNGTFQFLSVLMILYFVGNEEALGQVQAISALIAAGILYLVARKVTPQQRIKIMAAGVLLLIIGGLSFNFMYSVTGVILFMAFFSLAQPLLWVTINSLNMDVIDKEVRQTKDDYAYIVDSELFLNVGRVTGIVLFLFYYHIFSSEFALKVTPIAFGFAQLVLLFVARASHRRQRAEQMTVQLNEQH